MQKHPEPSSPNSACRSRTRAQSKCTKSKKPEPPRQNGEGPQDGGGFLSLLAERVGGWDGLEEINQRKHRAGRPAHRLTRGQLLAAVVYHYTVTWAGSLAEHLYCLLGIQMAESSLSERRQALPFEVFADLLRRVLRMIPKAGPQAFFGQWRLVAIDGVSFSLANTEQVKQKCKKGGNQKGRAAFAKLQCSALVELMMHNPLAACIGRNGESDRPLCIRLWTNLSCTEASAEELVRLYMARWEQELYFRELKWHLGINDLLRSQTVETAAQEVAAMIIGSSLIAHERAKLKPGEQLQHRVSFIKTWETLEPLWLVLLVGADILTDKQKQQLCERFYELAGRRMMPKKRNRSCPRAMRQPVQPWPRMRDQESVEGPIHVSVIANHP